MLKPTGMILWEGPSELNPDENIVAILTVKSSNTKTGNMLQTWILNQEGNPLAHTKEGTDDSICGDCKHRPSTGGACYVNVAWAPNRVHKSYLEGKYVDVTDGKLLPYKGRPVRLGAYGDPTAVPYGVWEHLLNKLGSRHTGYTHQYNSCDPRFSKILMASVDTEAEYDEARESGWRTFRVATSEEELVSGEFMCPASEEAGQKKQCITCLACDGNSRGNKKATPFIIVHGMRKSNFNKVV